MLLWYIASTLALFAYFGVTVRGLLRANAALRSERTEAQYRADTFHAQLTEERLLHADCPRCGPAYARMVADRAARGA